MDVIVTRQLTKAYRATRAVDALDLRVGAGEIYGLVGKNGAGKSTAMKMIAGLLNPTAGEIELFGDIVAGSGAPCLGLTGGPSRIGALIESPGILLTHSALDNLIIKALAVGELKAAEHARELLELVGLGGTGHKQAKGFSLGMKQRLGLALALVGHPDLLLLDEPFNGLDPEATRAMRSALMRINRERGVTMLISSHVLDQLDRMCTRFGVIREGRMVRELGTAELHERCENAIRVRTADPARAVTVLEERLPGARLQVMPDQAILVSLEGGSRPAAARFGGASGNPVNAGDASAERVSRALFDAGILILELTVLERDIEGYFVELMGGRDADGTRR
ncbi:MAG: ATP-binding cassette domain-containing protein [Coriobacteriaceae bacterium]|nr:ATP-binding cassette domain-containing protein [Coriobacteriaceae bacterium]